MQASISADKDKYESAVEKILNTEVRYREQERKQEGETANLDPLKPPE